MPKAAEYMHTVHTSARVWILCVSACLSWVQPRAVGSLCVCVSVSRCVCVCGMCARAPVYGGDGAHLRPGCRRMRQGHTAPGQSSPEAMILQLFIVLQ